MIQRQGELIFVPTEEVKGKKLNHLIIAEGKATGHKHEVTTGEAELYQNKDGVLYLKVNSDEAIVTHPNHKPVSFPKGDYQIITQREYTIGEEKYRKVVD